ncbi:MAG: guanylate kinase [Cytophagales bacterium]|nr:guanylate kinase [Cytophagales bacterium]
MMAGKLIIFSAPSGSGKTTIVRHILEKIPNVGFSISATTRTPRGQEVDGKDYYFLSLEDFKTRVEKDEFAEYEEVYAGVCYGTLKEEIERLWKEGKDVIFDIDVKGGVNLKNLYQDKALSIFVKVPSFEVLESRLRQRGTDTEEVIQTRLEKAMYETSFAEQFDEILVNDKLEDSFVLAEDLIGKFLEV